MCEFNDSKEEGDVAFGFERNNSSSSAIPPDPASFSDECLSVAEEAAEQVLNCIHPTLDSEEKRRDIVDYIQSLIKSHLNCEVFPYGSVPLKTYLPYGDIDLTTIKGPKPEESLAHDVLSILQREEENENAEFQVKDTKFIDAEVKLVKCLVQDIVIDISFNQLGGLSTLCFLEQIDRRVGRNHLFKRSIILVKTWCYYESRILGAHHGLISTFALETLVLYIFQFSHSSLGGPLSVLYSFLDYYSKFDWENYCISLKGPVCKSSLPDIVVKTPESGWNNLTLTEEFLEKCTEMFSVPSREPDRKAFQTKHLNIIDPLKENNNLGRSVHIGNFYRIKSALKYGARKLGQVLSRPREKIADGISEFFTNTLARHGQHCRASIRHLTVEFGDEDSLTASLSSPVELSSEDDMLLKSPVSDFGNDSVVGHEDKSTLEFKNELEKYSVEVSSDYTSNSNCSVFYRNLCNKTHSFKSSAENGSFEAYQLNSSGCTSQNSFDSWLENSERYVHSKTYGWCMENTEAVYTTGSSSSTQKANILDSQTLDCIDIDSTSIDSEALDPLVDLNGDYDSHIRSLLYGQLCHGFTFPSPVSSNPSSNSNFQNKKPWDVVRQSMPLRHTEFSSKPMSMEQTMYLAAANRAHFASTFCFEGKDKTRGTGTYFPNMNAFYMERTSYGRGRNKTGGNRIQSHKYGSSYNLWRKSYSSENAKHETVPARSKYQGRGRSDVRCQSPRVNGYANASTCGIEFGSIGNLAKEFISGPTHVKGSTLGPSQVMNQDRFAGRAIHLKNEEEFPPLCQ